jgi:hypothetical protein
LPKSVCAATQQKAVRVRRSILVGLRFRDSIPRSACEMATEVGFEEIAGLNHFSCTLECS